MTHLIELVGFDGDDTLWHSERGFHVAQDEIRAILADHCDPTVLDRRLIEVERTNLHRYGYGAKAFTLSVIETATELAGDRLTVDDVRAILDVGKRLLAHPVELLPGVEQAIRATAARHPIVLITKGDLFHQESKVAGSGLGDLFSGVEIVSEKDPEQYRRVLARYGADPTGFVMVGNSLRSDVGPVLELGGWGVHVPHEYAWELEAHDDEDAVRAHPRFRSCPDLTTLVRVLDTFGADAPDPPPGCP
ncbi:MAG: HAD family hydrolase [Actinobacteria bacterium]|nr:HAD family hydrolase [Actinomycetota bacterium]